MGIFSFLLQPRKNLFIWKISFRRLVSPFLFMYYPDKIASIPVAQKVNLEAVQTINEMIDACEELTTEEARSF